MQRYDDALGVMRDDYVRKLNKKDKVIARLRKQSLDLTDRIDELSNQLDQSTEALRQMKRVTSTDLKAKVASKLLRKNQVVLYGEVARLKERLETVTTANSKLVAYREECFRLRS